MAFIRLGTCGALQPPARLGSFVVAEPGAYLIRRNPDAFSPEGLASGLPPYTFSQPIPSDSVLSLALQLEAARLMGAEGVCCGLNATADSFYSSQGRWVLAAGGGQHRCRLPVPAVATAQLWLPRLLLPTHAVAGACFCAALPPLVLHPLDLHFVCNLASYARHPAQLCAS